MQSFNFWALWDAVLSLWEWAWNWHIPIGGTYQINPIQIGLGIWIVDFILDLIFPSPHDMIKEDK